MKGNGRDVRPSCEIDVPLAWNPTDWPESLPATYSIHNLIIITHKAVGD